MASINTGKSYHPLNGLHANICTFRVGAVQAKGLRIFVQLKFAWEKMKMGVTYVDHTQGNDVNEDGVDSVSVVQL